MQCMQGVKRESGWTVYTLILLRPNQYNMSDRNRQSHGYHPE